MAARLRATVIGQVMAEERGKTSRGPATSGLRGRRTESAVLAEAISAVRQGESRTLVVRGDAGVGKTALLEHALESATGLRVLRAAGIESEMELPFAALHQLCAPILDALERLPNPQREALSIVFGRIAGPLETLDPRLAHCGGDPTVSTADVRSGEASAVPGVENVDLKFEAVVLPVADIDRAKEFYSSLCELCEDQGDAAPRRRPGLQLMCRLVG